MRCLFVHSLWGDPVSSFGKLKPSALLDFSVRLVSFPKRRLCLFHLRALSLAVMEAAGVFMVPYVTSNYYFL